MLRLLRTRRWISFTVTAILAIVAFGLLSHWQWDRAHQRQAEAAAMITGSQADPVPISAVIAPDEPLAQGDEWRSVSAVGRFDCADGYLIRNQPMDGSNGFWAACPLLTKEGAALWVNRGWMPTTGNATQSVPMPPAPAGEVSVVGRLRASQGGPAAVPADLPAGQATDLNTSVLSATAGLSDPVYQPYIEAESMVPADPADLQPLPLPTPNSAQNYSYAGQWLLFAAIAIGGWFYFLRREAADEAAAGAEQAEPAPAP